MFWGFTIIYQDDNSITALRNVAPNAIIVVNIADYPATAMIVYDDRIGIAGRPQNATADRCAINWYLDILR